MLKTLLLAAFCIFSLVSGDPPIQGFMAYQDVQQLKTLNLTNPQRFVFDFYHAQPKAMNHWEQLINRCGLAKRVYHYQDFTRWVIDLQGHQQTVSVHRQNAGYVLSLTGCINKQSSSSGNKNSSNTKTSKIQKKTNIQRTTKTNQVDHIQPKKNVTIIIDPGHGGRDSGAIGQDGTYEKDIVLRISLQVASYLNKQPGYKAYLTRKSDQYLTLRERLGAARLHSADAFASIHADAFYNTTAHGLSVFSLSTHGASSEAAYWLARKNNETLVSGLDLSPHSKDIQRMLIHLQQSSTLTLSDKLGQSILNTFKNHLTLHKSTLQQAGFVVLKSPDIPSVLVEVGFLTNHQELEKLKSKTFQKQFARQLGQGIIRYFNETQPQTKFIIVKPKQTLYNLSKMLNVSVSELKARNKLSGSQIQIGQKIYY